MSIAVISSNITKNSNTIDLYQGESRDIELEVVEDIPDVNGVLAEQPVDLTGAAIYLSVRSKPSSPELLLSKNSTNTASIEINTPPTSGLVTIHMVSADTKFMFPGGYVFDVWVVLASGKSVPVIEISEFIIKEPVTKLQ